MCRGGPKAARRRGELHPGGGAEGAGSKRVRPGQSAGALMSTAAAIIIGNEILSAKVQDENGPFLARELRSLGVELRRIETVPDEVPLIVDALQRCLRSAQWVFTSGGIGPTHDDVTIAAVSCATAAPAHNATIIAAARRIVAPLKNSLLPRRARRSRRSPSQRSPRPPRSPR